MFNAFFTTHTHLQTSHNRYYYYIYVGVENSDKKKNSYHFFDNLWLASIALSSRHTILLFIVCSFIQIIHIIRWRFMLVFCWKLMFLLIKYILIGENKIWVVKNLSVCDYINEQRQAIFFMSKSMWSGRRETNVWRFHIQVVNPHQSLYFTNNLKMI